MELFHTNSRFIQSIHLKYSPHPEVQQRCWAIFTKSKYFIISSLCPLNNNYQLKIPSRHLDICEYFAFSNKLSDVVFPQKKKKSPNTSLKFLLNDMHFSLIKKKPWTMNLQTFFNWFIKRFNSCIQAASHCAFKFPHHTCVNCDVTKSSYMCRC